MKEVVIGNRGADHLALETDHARDLGLWVVAHVQTGTFRGSVRSWTYTGVLRSFAQELRTLERTLKGTVKLNLEEDVLSAELSGDGVGHIRVAGALRSNTVVPRALLKFEFTIDQTYLGPAILALEEAEPAGA